ncbi:MAG: hypothetical protein AB7O97_08260 [Planctomycetota bacterium]
MSDVHRNLLLDLGYELKQSALEARRERDAAPKGSEAYSFKSGRLIAFYEIVSMMRNLADSFGVPLSDIRLDDIMPDRDLL